VTAYDLAILAFVFGAGVLWGWCRWGLELRASRQLLGAIRPPLRLVRRDQ